MAERLTHRRTKGPASTPAQRLVELQQELTHTKSLLEERTIEALRLHERLKRYESLGGTSFGGIEMAQVLADLWLWEGLLNDNPQLRGIIELGTWNGGFAWWLWAQAEVRNMNFYTFDAVRPEHRMPPYAFEKRDVFAEIDKTAHLLRLCEPVILLCDNGNKPRELQTFAPELRDPGSLIVVHDWGTEIVLDDVPESVEMVYEQVCVELRSMSRVFRLRRDEDG